MRQEHVEYDAKNTSKLNSMLRRSGRQPLRRIDQVTPPVLEASSSTPVSASLATAPRHGVAARLFYQAVLVNHDVARSNGSHLGSK